MPSLDQVHGNKLISFSCHSSLSAHNTQHMSTTQATISRDTEITSRLRKTTTYPRSRK